MAQSKFVIILLACVVAASCAEQNETGGENYISGGRARPHQFPFLVALRTPNNQHICAGTILNERWVLSAAHCTLNRHSVARNVHIFVGVHDQTDGVKYLTEAIVNHPDFNRRDLLNDICLVRSATNIKMVQGRVEPIRLPRPNRPENLREPLYAVGWGVSVNPNRNEPHFLQYQQGLTISNKQCRDRVPLNLASIVQKNKLCTLYPKGQSTCRDDSGGPLVDRQGVVVGVVSWGIPCEKQYPDVFVRVSSFIAWIQQLTGAQPQ